MVETKDPEEPTLASKRKPDPSCEDNEGHPNKTQKLQNPNNNSQLPEDKTQNSDEKDVDLDAQDAQDAQEENNSDAAAAEDDESDDDDDVDSNGEATEVDRKGKGILVEEGEDESDDDDSSDGGSQSDGDSDLSDDPLAEVDLDNILPSRTRRKVIQPGNYIANDLGGRDDDDSDSDA